MDNFDFFFLIGCDRPLRHFKILFKIIFNIIIKPFISIPVLTTKSLFETQLHFITETGHAEYFFDFFLAGGGVDPPLIGNMFP